MRVPDELRECVCFLKCRWTGKPGVGVGTAFFLAAPLGLDTGHAQYVATAKHVLFDDEGRGLADDIRLWVNTADGQRAEVATRPSDWVLHPAADLAILPIGDGLPGVAYTLYPTESFARPDFLREKQIGAGDDVFMPGLFARLPAASRMEPVLRLGSVAAMPPDPVVLDTGQGSYAHTVALVEARSIGGISGSPVFVHLPVWRDTEEGMVLIGTGAKAASGGTERLLGVMHGFYPVGPEDPDRVSGGDENLNTGIAVVVLAETLMDLIDHPQQVRLREMEKDRREKQQAPKPARGNVRDEPENEFGRFEDLTRKLVNTPKSEVDKKRKAEKDAS